MTLDFAELYNLNSIAIIYPFDEDLTGNENHQIVHIPVGNEVNCSDLVAHNVEDIDMALVIHEACGGNIEAFQSLRLPILMPWRKSLKAGRLDSQVFYFQTSVNIITLHESYTIKSTIAITRSFGTWSKSQGLNIPNPNIWRRRSDLNGIRLVNVILDWSTFNVYEVNKTGHPVDLDGPMPQILNHLSKVMNFTYLTVLPKDGKWGSQSSINGTWNGLMGRVAEGMADISGSGLTWTLERDAVVDFSHPLVESFMTLIAPVRKGDRHKAKFWVYRDIFPAEMWLSCLGIGLALVLSWQLLLKELFNPITFVDLQMLQIGSIINCSNTSANMLFCVTSAFAYLIFTYYTCDLTARMTSGSPDNPIRSFQDVIDRGYQVVVQACIISALIIMSSPWFSAKKVVIFNLRVCGLNIGE